MGSGRCIMKRRMGSGKDTARFESIDKSRGASLAPAFINEIHVQ